MKDYNVHIDGKHFFHQPINNDTKTYENIRKIATGQGDDYTTGCLLDYPYFKENYKMIAIDLSNNKLMTLLLGQFNNQFHCKSRQSRKNNNDFCIIEEAKETVSYFSQGTVKIL